MENQSEHHGLPFDEITEQLLNSRRTDDEFGQGPEDDLLTALNKITEVQNFFEENRLPGLSALLKKLVEPAGKRSFLVYKHQKYIIVPTNIAVFCVEYESTTLICFDGQQYSLCQSLEQIQNQLSQKQYFRVNRQILLNFRAVLEVEHYFARKLFVKLAVPLREKLLVSKERASSFLQWLENR